MKTLPRRSLLCLVAVVGCGFAAAPAQAVNTDFNILAGQAKDAAGNDVPGKLDLLTIGPHNSKVDVFEIVGAQKVPVKSFYLTTPITYGVPPNARTYGYLQDAGFAKWRCDRRERRFGATATTSTQVFTADVTELKTPSCAKRFKTTLPLRAKTGKTVTAKVTDTFALGDVKPTLCVTPPKVKKSKKVPRPKKPKTVCRKLGIRAGALTASKRVKVKTKGTWTFELRSTGQKTRLTVAVGGVKVKRPKTGVPVLLVGDSLMENIVTPVADRLTGTADVSTLTRGGGRLTEPGFDWVKQGTAVTNRVKPRVTAVLLGGGDGFPIGGVQCCGAPWINAYAPYVKRFAQALSRGGQTNVIFVLYPAAEAAGQRAVQLAVNQASVNLAASNTVPRLSLVDLNPLISPGFVYSEFKVVNGVSHKIRDDDGIHFTIFGATLAGNFLADQMKAKLSSP